MEKPTILIADDESRLRISLSLLLEKDFNILTAANGKEVLSHLNNSSISLILLDIVMPVMNGLESLQIIRSADKFIKIIIMTGKSTHEWAKKCADLNVQGYVEKPFHTNDLLAKIKEVLHINAYPLLQEQWGSDYKKKLDSVSLPIRRAFDFIDKNNDGELRRESLASYLNLNPDYLSRLFHRECGIELQEYIHWSKIEKIKLLLSTRFDMKIKDVAGASGFRDTAYFSRFFKRHTGLTPGSFRKKALIFIHK